MSEWGNEGRSIPRLLTCLLCEDAALSLGVNDRRLTVQRIIFDVQADRFPAVCDRMVAVTIWRGEDGACRETVRIVAPDGTVVAWAEVELVTSSEMVSNTQLFNFPTVELPQAGEYAVEVLVGDAVVHSHPLLAVEKGEERADQ
jgi:hypothetical protein